MNYSWIDFISKSRNTQNDFEDLARVFFKIKYTGSISTVLNQTRTNPGLETEPISVQGIKIGFQAKFFEANINYVSIVESLEKVITYYAGKVDKVILFSNKDVSLNTKSLKKVLEDLCAENIIVETVCNKNILDLINYDSNYSCLKSTFFTDDSYDKEWFDSKLRQSIKNLGPRYTKDFNVENVNYEEYFDTFYKNEKGKELVIGCIKDVISSLDNLLIKDETIKELRSILFDTYISSKKQITDALRIYERIRPYVAKIEDIISSNKDDEHFDYYRYSRVINIVEELNQNNALFRLFESKVLVVEGDAGTGKSHLLAHEAEKHSDNSNSILLPGHTLISNASPEDQIKSYLNLSCSVFDFLNTLNTIGSSKEEVSLIYFDAVNECYNHNNWSQFLARLVYKIQELDYVKIVFSIRSTYFDGIFIGDFLNAINSGKWFKIYHLGFDYDPLFACKSFFEHYNILFDPLLGLEKDFSNPMFLKMYCEVEKEKSFVKKPDIFTIYDEFVNKEENKIKLKNGINDARSLSSIVFDVCYNKYILDNKSSFDKQEIDCLLKEENINSAFIDGLVYSGVFSKFLSNNKEYLYFGFELFFEYCMAKRILESMPSIDEITVFCNETLLKKNSFGHINYNSAGIFSILANLVKKRFGVELIECIKSSTFNRDSYQKLINSYFDLYLRRDDELIDKEFVLDCFNKKIIKTDRFFEICLNCWFRDCNLNYNYLNEYLMGLDLPIRDFCWTLFLNDSFYNEGCVSRLINLLYENDFDFKDKKIPISILFSWFLVSNNQTIRDKSTKILVKLLINDPNTCSMLINNFHNVNDPYVLERLYGSIYGSVLNSDITPNYQQLGQLIFEYCFRNKPINDILIRDYAGNTIDYLSKNNICFDFDVKSCFPPFAKQKIPNIPVSKLLKLYQDEDDEDYRKRAGTMAIKRSLNPEYGIKGFSDTIYGDFGRYTFGNKLSHFEGMQQELVFKYAFFYLINNLGYTDELFAAYDRSLRDYSRSRPTLERIGKKYEWITMYHTLALVADMYKYTELYSDVSYLECKGAWRFNVRDLDYSFVDKAKNDGEFTNLKREKYNDWDTETSDWCSTVDISSFSSDILLSDNLISLYYSNNDENEKVEETRQSVWKSAIGMLIKRDEFKASLSAIKNKKMLYLFNDCSPTQVYNIMLKEFGFSIPYFDEFQSYFEVDIEADSNEKEMVDTPVIKKIGKKMIVEITKKETYKRKTIGKLIPTSSIYTWESYKDSTINDSRNSFMPSKFLIEKMSLRQKSAFIWSNEKGPICYDMSNLNNNGINGLYINKSELINFLTANNLEIIWFCFANKLEYSTFKSGKRVDKQAIVYFDKDYNLVEDLLYKESD